MNSFVIVIGEYELLCTLNGFPTDIEYYSHNARLVDHLHTPDTRLNRCSFTLFFDSQPMLVVTGQYIDGYVPGVLYIPETHLFFVGTGTHIAAFRLDKPKKLWHEAFPEGADFLRWTRSGEFILMSSERELAAWDIYGWKKWSVPVEPPCHYNVQKGMIELESAGEKTAFPLDIGPLTFED